MRRGRRLRKGFLGALGETSLSHLALGQNESASVSPLATEIMSEAGIDISGQRVREVASLFRETFHCVVALCDEAHQAAVEPE